MAGSATYNGRSPRFYNTSFSSYSTPSLATTLVNEPDEVPRLNLMNLSKHAVHDEVYEDDVIIALLGPTGSGKSSFIRAATEDPRVIIGHGLQSCTSDIQVIRCKHPKDAHRNVVFVDTPGFDDTYISDADILRAIAAWLASTFRRKITLSGLLYFHRISDIRMSGIPVSNLTLLKKICGRDAWQNITFVTTMWDEVNADTGVARENDLCENYWKAVISRGAGVRRFRGTTKAAWEIVDYSQHTPRALLLQTQMVNKGLPLPQTSAGKVLLMSIKELIKALKKSLARLQRLLRNSANMKDSPDKLRDSLYEKKGELENLSLQLKKLETPVDDIVLGNTPIDTHSPSSRNGKNRSSTMPATLNGPISLAPYPIGTIPSLSEAKFVDGALYALKMGLQTAGSITPFAKAAVDILLSIWNGAMRDTQELLLALVKDAAYFTTAVVDQARVVGATPEMCQIISTLVRDLSSVQNLLQRVAARNAMDRFILQPEDERLVRKCHEAIKNTIEGFHLRAVVLMHSGLKQLQDRVDDLANNRIHHNPGQLPLSENPTSVSF